MRLIEVFFGNDLELTIYIILICLIGYSVSYSRHHEQVTVNHFLGRIVDFSLDINGSFKSFKGIDVIDVRMTFSVDLVTKLHLVEEF